MEANMIQVISNMNNPKLAEMKVVYRRDRKSTGTPIRRAFDLVTYLRKIWNDESIDLREEVVMVCMSPAHEVKGWIRIAEGGLSSATIDFRLLFGVLLTTASVSFILAHNHPSGSLEPSSEDIRLTKTLSESAKLLGLRLLDHIIITSTGYRSLCEAGELL
jgi:DNA repair protein RadC